MTGTLIPLARAVATQAMAYPYKIWGFGEGIALRAVWQAEQVLDEPLYREWVLGLLEQWLHRDPCLQEADHSAPGFALLDAYEANGDERYLSLALELAAYMVDLPRHPSGALYHRPQHPDFRHYIYVDCLEVDAPFFCRLGQITGSPVYYDQAAQQLLSYCRLLQDNDTGLFYHQFDGQTGQVNGAFWGRGNGWAMLGLLETLRLLPKTHPDWNSISVRLVKQADALSNCQLPAGDWPTVLDQPYTYAEGSLPAMFYYGFAHGVRLKLLPDRYQTVIERAWNALQGRLSPDGILQGVSVATPPGDAAHYAQVKTGGLFPWGQGPALLSVLERTGRQN